MAILKIATTYYNGEERAVYLVQGNATRDGESAPVRGRPHGRVAVAAAVNREEQTLFVTLNGWRGRAAEVAAIRKMDSVLALGVLKQREHNAVVYYDLDVDFLCVSGAGVESGGARCTGAPLLAEAEGFADLPEAGELPF